MLTLGNTSAIRGLGERLRKLGFTPAAVNERLGAEGHLIRTRPDEAVQLRRLDDSPLASAIKLLFLGAPTPIEDARRALDPVPIDELEELGLLERIGDEIRACVHLAPFEDLLLTSDRAEALDEGQASADHVGPVNPTSVTLSKLTVRRPVEAALDLGTGCGIQALLLATHARRVVATDVNPRALRYTEFNALLNDVSNIETGEGSLFAPVEGERFDLVVSNPPFVVSPDSRFSFRDSGLRGDEICREVVTGAGALLREGGYATVLCNWVRQVDEEWQSAPRRWIESTACDAWVLNQGGEDPLKYASVWNQFLRMSDPDAYAATLDRWVDHHRTLGVEAIHYGAIILRRRSDARAWQRFDNLPSGSIGSAAEHIVRVFEAQDHLNSLPDEEAFLAERLVLVEEHRLEQALRFQEAEYRIDASTLRLEEGIAFEGPVDAYALHVLGRCDGERTVREAIAEVARLGDLEEREFERSAGRVLRRLFALGFLVRAR